MGDYKKKLPIGVENFEDLRHENFYYVDKTYMIRDILRHLSKVTLFTRPRRFGKSLNMMYRLPRLSKKAIMTRW